MKNSWAEFETREMRKVLSKLDNLVFINQAILAKQRTLVLSIGIILVLNLISVGILLYWSLTNSRLGTAIGQGSREYPARKGLYLKNTLANIPEIIAKVGVADIGTSGTPTNFELLVSEVSTLPKGHLQTACARFQPRIAATVTEEGGSVVIFCDYWFLLEDSSNGSHFVQQPIGCWQWGNNPSGRPARNPGRMNTPEKPLWFVQNLRGCVEAPVRSYFPPARLAANGCGSTNESLREAMRHNLMMTISPIRVLVARAIRVNCVKLTDEEFLGRIRNPRNEKSS